MDRTSSTTPPSTAGTGSRRTSRSRNPPPPPLSERPLDRTAGAILSVVVAFPVPEESRRTSFVGMVMALASWTMLFVALFFSYAVLRLNAPTWPPDGLAPLPKALPFLNTLVLLASSAVLSRGTRRESEGRPGVLRRALLATMALGGLFLALQLAVWIPLWQTGFRIDNTGSYGSIFYGLTVFHALHVLAGLLALAVLLPGAFSGRLASGRSSRVRVSAMFWHFVDVVWVVMFVAVYLL